MKKNIIKAVLIFLLFGLICWDRVPVSENIDQIQEHAKEVNGDKKLPPKEFKTDGCTLWPDSLLNYSWQDKCIEHDIQYWVGGTEEERDLADLRLRDDVNGVLPGMGSIVYLGVRAGGRSFNSLIPWPWGWGFGWNNGEATTSSYLNK
ncbi:hypothetical protein KKC45_01275 [Patescibacteria group bacterium]|nr:hypothetical protein [Patescibacteria group bacterium]